MNKKEISDLLPKAYQVLADVKIAKNNKVEKAYRSQLAMFGTAAATGSIGAAISIFQNTDRNTKANSLLIIDALKLLVNKDDLFDFAKNDERQAKRQIINAAVALKLAINLYELTDKG